MTGYKRNRKKRTHLSEEWRNSQLCKRQFKNNISNLRHSYIISLKDTENLEKSVLQRYSQRPMVTWQLSRTVFKTKFVLYWK